MSVRDLSSFGDALRLRAERQPDRPAYLFLEDGEREAESCTYAELDRRARAIAATLQGMGLARERALLLYPPGLELVSAFFGCLYAGVVAVPAYPPRVNRNQARLRSIAVDARPGVALTTAPIRLRAGALGREVPELAEVPWLATEEVPDEMARAWVDPCLGPDALAFLQYTSGSTSAPKGVMVSHGNILHNERVIEAACRHDGDSTFVSWLPMYHDMGLIGGLLQPLWIGALGVLMAPVAFLQKPSRWLQAISRYGAHTSGAPNFAYELCLRKVTAEESAGLDLSSWQVAFNGAEPVRAETLRRFAERFAPHGFRPETAFPCYGLAEATLFVTGGPKGTPTTVVPFEVRALLEHRVEEAGPESTDARELPGCGIPWLGHEVRIVHPETRLACAGGEVGEIWVGGPSVAQGYWSRPDVTAESFGARLADTGEGPFLRTGDLGFLHRGELFVTGRIKDLVIIRGRNHYPQDIELTVERSHPALRPGCGAVFSVEIEGDERLVAVQEVEREQQRRLDVEAVAAEIRRAVAEEHEIQVHEVVLVRIGTVPKTSSGKVQRRACRASYLEGRIEAVGASVLRTEADEAPVESDVLRLEDLAGLPPAERSGLLETALRSELARILRMSPARIPADAPLTSLGLDSLNALELRHRLESALGIELPLAALLEGISLSQLALPSPGGPGVRMGEGPGVRAEGHERLDSGAVDDETPESPLSRGQRALWFVHGLAPESGAYNIAGLARVRGSLNTDALRRSFVRLAARHAALRSTFPVSHGEPRQRVRPETEAESAVDFLVLEGISGLEEALHAPFDLERGPVLRVRVFALPDGDVLLALAVHHLVADFWSLGVLARELGAVYGEETGGPAASLAPLPLRYGDFVRWQERMLAGPRGERLWEHWRARLAGELPPLDLPTDRPRPAVQTYHGAARSLHLDAELTGALHGLGRGRGATLFATLLAGFQALLQRWTGQDDLTVGSPVAGRTSAAWGGVVGYFVNPLVLRADLAGDPAFADHLDRTRQRVLDAFEHQDLPFALLAERLQPVRDPGRPPLFQVAFALQSLPGGDDLAGFALGEPGSRLQTGPLVLESVAMPRRASQFDLTLLLGDMGGRLAACCQYNPDLFDEATVARLLGGFETLLRGAVASPDLRLSDLPLLTTAERDQLLLEWNGEPPAAAWEAGVVPLVLGHAERNPDAPALVSGGETTTYGELDRRSLEIALHLRSAGVGPETVVGVALERGPEMVAALLGVLRAGGAYLPLDPADPTDPTDPNTRRAVILGEAGVSIVITREHPCLAGEAPPTDLPEPGPDNLAYVIYTSGSTGTPKGVEIRHGSLLNLVRWHQQVYGVTAVDRATQVAAVTFDAAVWEIWPYLCAGASLHFPPPELRSDPAGLAGWLERERITLAFLPTPLAEAVLAEGRFEAPVAPALRALLTGGDRLRRGPGPDVPFAFFNHYGPTESTVVTTWTRVEPGEELPSIGHPMAGTRVYLTDRRGNPAPLGVPGEIRIGGTGLARGYRGRPEITAASFVPDPFGGEPGGRLYRTGDLARRRPDGRLDFLGRIDHQVKIRGFRIEPGEVEAALRRHPAVQDAIVLARDLGAGPALVAWAAGSSSSEELRSFLAERLPAWMVPSAVVVLEALPLTSHGKVDRRALPDPEKAVGTGGAPRTPAEELLAGIWRDVLGVEPDREADFFALGGHSLKVAQVVSRLRDATGVELELSAAFEEPTLAGLALRVEDALRRSASPAPVLRPVRREGPAPLSFAQERLWFLDRLEPGSSAYAIPVALRMEGELRPDLLEAALAAVVARHESLRTTIALAAGPDGEPVQVVTSSPVILPRVDLPESEVMDFLRDEARRPFDLARGPLARFLLVRLASDVHLFLATLHHIVADGWSLNILLEELAEVHEALRTGRGPVLRELPVQYAEYAVWQREWLQGEELESRIAPWRERLAGLPRLELPADRPRPGISTSRGGAVPVLLPPDLPEALAAFGRREAATPYMVLLAAFAALLQRHAGQTDLAVGSPAAGRNRSEVERLVGLFVNTVVLRLELAPEEPFRAVLDRARERTVEAFANQDLPYEKLVEALQPERVAGRGELFQAMLSFQGAPVALPALEGLRLSPVTIDRGAAQTDLSLDVVATDAGWLASLEYAADLFDEATARRLAERFSILLGGVLADPSMPLADLPLLSEAERVQLLGEWSGATDQTPDLPIHETIAEQARRTPEAVAVVGGGIELTYRELLSRSNALAAHLRRLGVGPEVPVGLAAERSPEMIVGLLGILQAGGAYLPLDPALPQERRNLMLDDAGVNVVVGRQVLEAAPDRPEEPPVRVSPQISPETAAYILYTSGSTGRPKGVVVSHGALSRFARRAAARYGLEPGDRVLQFASLAFDTSVEEIYPALASGATLVLREGELAGSAAAFLESAARQGITVLDLPTAYWHEVAAGLSEERVAAPAGLRLVIIGGEKALAERWAAWRERLPGVRLVNTYGPTEGTVVATSYEGSGPGDIPIGRPWPGTRVFLLDPSLRPVPPGAVGELCLAGDNLARGYLGGLGRPDLTAERFLPDPWGPAGSRLYRTGDLARFLPDGSLEYRGRIDHQVKLRGFRVEPGEIEAALVRHPRVREAAVVARPAGTGSVLLAAYVVADAMDSSELRAFLRGELPEYMVPAAIVALPSLPRNSSGKIDRRALPEPDLAQPSEMAAPRTPLEELIAGLWREVLGTGRVALRESFFDLGGHSLTAARLTARLSRDLGLEVPLRDLFENPTVEGLARRIEERLRGGASAPPPLQAGGHRESHPLSFAQQRLWFLDRLDPGSPAYHLPAVVRFRGPLRPDALEAALAAVARRHESLRTRFAEVGGEPVQIVSPEAPVSLPRIDLAGLPDSIRRAEALRLARAEAVRAFDLTAGPLLRAHLVTLGPALGPALGPEDHELILVQHHIVTDGWSLDLLAGELAALYDAALDGRPSPLPEPQVQYGDFASWQRRWLEGEARQRLVDHWRDRLRGLGSLELPSDRPRPAVQTFRGGSLAFELPGVSAGDLETFGRRQGATLFITLLAAFQGLLSRWSGQADVAVGSPVAGRVRPELEDLIGFFVNTLVLRADVGGAPSFGDLLARVRESTLDAFAHQDLPFEVLVEELQPVREQGRSPLFQVLFGLQPPSRPLALRGLEAAVEELDAGAAKFDLALSLAPRGDVLSGWMEINADLFDPATALRLVRSFETLLRNAVADPGRPVSELPLLTLAERRQLLEEWNATSRPYAGPELLHERIEAQAARTPSAEAVRFEDGSLSYAELDLRANGLAFHLRKLGVGPDVLVGVCMERSLELVVSLLAVLKAGGAYVPLDPGYPAERLAYMLEDSGTPVLLTQARLAGLLPFVAQTVLVDETEWAGEPSNVEVDPDGLAYMIYTSGSTGRPKGAMNTHRAIVNRLLWMQEAYGLGAGDRVLQKTPFSFDVSVWEFFWPLMTGACLVVARPEGHRDGAYLVDLIRRERVTTLHFVPSMLRAFLEQPGVEECTSIRRVVCSGEALPHELQERFFSRSSAELHNLYGPTEAAVDVSFWACRRDDERSLVPIGHPIANVRLHVLDSFGEPCPVGVPGELHIGGVALARGYWGRPELTADRFVPDPFAEGGRLYRTGDLARVLPDGSIDYLGRLDHQVKIRGFRIELGEIEAALEDQPSVREAAVVVRADGTGDPRLVACIVPRGEAPEVNDLRQALRRILPDHMVPALFVALDAMPLTPSGKLDRKALAASGGERAAAEAEYVAPRTAEETTLAGIWAAVLGVDRVGVRDDFFQLGGHSLKATQVVSRVRDTFGVEVPLRQLFAEPTVEGLARAVSGAKSSQGPQRPQREIPVIRAAARGTGNLDELLAKVRQKKSAKG
jgi:amino acid adenylation domain-containing protein